MPGELSVPALPCTQEVRWHAALGSQLKKLLPGDRVKELLRIEEVAGQGGALNDGTVEVDSQRHQRMLGLPAFPTTNEGGVGEGRHTQQTMRPLGETTKPGT